MVFVFEAGNIDLEANLHREIVDLRLDKLLEFLRRAMALF